MLILRSYLHRSLATSKFTWGSKYTYVVPFTLDEITLKSTV